VAVETRIDADDEWFVGEDRVLRFRFVEGDTTGIAGWPMEFALFARRAKPSDPPLLTAPAAGVDATDVTPALAQVIIDGDTTALLDPGVYGFALRRTDVGARSILSFGPCELRSVTS
jgi:hypothetical protein